MKAKQLLKKATDILDKQGIIEAANDAWLLFEDTFNVNRTWFYLHDGDEISPDDEEEYFNRINRRASHEPLQYIMGKAYFMGLQFAVNKNVLIPRFDTEILVEEVLKHARAGMSVLDMCTGSGCIGLSVASLSDVKSVTLVDISDGAISVARENESELKVHNTRIIKSNMFDNVNDTFDIIISNPPYIRSADILELMSEVKDNEPMLALDGTEDGLYFYRILASEGYEHLNAGGGIFMEIGYDQAEDVSRLLVKNSFTDVTVIKDLAGLDRVVCGWRK